MSGKIDGRKLGSLIPGSRKQKALSEEELDQIASVYREFKKEKSPEEQPGFAAVASLDQVREYGYALSPGRYVGAEVNDEEGEPFEELYPKLVEELEEQMDKSQELSDTIRKNLEMVKEYM